MAMSSILNEVIVFTTICKWTYIRIKGGLWSRNDQYKNKRQLDANDRITSATPLAPIQRTVCRNQNQVRSSTDLTRFHLYFNVRSAHQGENLKSSFPYRQPVGEEQEVSSRGRHGKVLDAVAVRFRSCVNEDHDLTRINIQQQQWARMRKQNHEGRRGGRRGGGGGFSARMRKGGREERQRLE